MVSELSVLANVQDQIAAIARIMGMLATITTPREVCYVLCLAKYKFNNSIRRLAIAAFTDHYYSQTT